MTDEVLFENRGAISYITFNLAQNGQGLTAPAIRAVCDRCKAIAANRALRAVVLRGQNGTFVSGNDMRIYSGDKNAVQDHAYQKIQFFNGIIREIQTMEKPVIAAAQGRITGVGFNLILACDLVIAAQSAVFNADFAEHALMPDAGATFFLPRKAGSARASEILMLGEDFSAEKAEQWGLINRVVADDALEAATTAWAEKLAQGAPRVLGAAKALLGKSFEQNLSTQLSQEAAAWTAISKSYDFLESIKATIAKRPAKFTGA